jgi:mannose-6-phosphate isomerase
MSGYDLLRFTEQYQERIWGGQKLRSLFEKDIPADRPIGEAWLVSDHPGSESVVADGPHAGRSLHDLVEENPEALLGSRAQRTPHGRFPLLLKILDAREILSVQVHPDDETARRLNEPDVGKTEMWHVLQSDPYSELICGLDPSVTREEFEGVADSPEVAELMVRFAAPEGTNVFVPAGTVHAIGGGIVLAEIQQNSDITYRLYDWGRLQADGKPRTLHLQKAMESIRFGSTHTGPNRALSYDDGGATRTVLAACRYFAAEAVAVQERYGRETRGESFHIVLAKDEPLQFRVNGTSATARAGEALLIAGSVPYYEVEGTGTYLDYYVPDLRKDVMAPLQKAGHSQEEIVRLGGDPATSDLNI